MPHDLIPLPPNSGPDLLADLFAADLSQAKALVAEELSKSTRQGYVRDMRAFGLRAANRGVALERDEEGRLLTPISPAMVAGFIAASVTAGTIRAGTLARRLAAIAYACKTSGQPDPTREPAIRSALKAARRRLGVAPVNRKAALDPTMLLAMLELCPGTLTGKRDRAMLSLGWALALRRSELVALQVEDVETVPGGIHVQIRRSKTDQEAAGVTVAVPDRVRDRIRPARDLRAWLKAAKIKAGPIFRRVNKAGHLQDQLDGGSVGLVVKAYSKLAGFDVDSLGGHSLRTGFVTSAAAIGASVATLANVTRHSSADVLLGYVRTANLVADYPVAILK